MRAAWLGAWILLGQAWAWQPHDWSNAQAMQFIDFGYQTLTDAQAAFVASHYRIVSIEKCTGYPALTTEAGFLRSAQLLKAHDPTVQTLLYWDTNQGWLQCYGAKDGLLTRPDWWLRSASGAVLYVDEANGIPYLNTSVPEARAWWAGVPMAVHAANRSLLDGVFVDGTSAWCPAQTPDCGALVSGRAAMVALLRALLANATGGAGVVLGNGLSMYSPARNNELDSLANMDGIMLEHFAVFEQVVQGSLNVPLVAQALQRVADAAATGKLVAMACWPGPFTDAFDARGFPGWAGNVSAPTTYAGWRAALLQYAPFALAAFLTVAEPNVFMQYQVWYNGFSQGAIPCDAAPTTCAAPSAATWYPDWLKPIGPPLGAATRAGNVWTRRFAFATSTLDLDAPLARSGVSFMAAPTTVLTTSPPSALTTSPPSALTTSPSSALTTPSPPVLTTPTTQASTPATPVPPAAPASISVPVIVATSVGGACALVLVAVLVLHSWH